MTTRYSSKRRVDFNENANLQQPKTKKIQQQSSRSTTLLAHEVKKFNREPYIVSGYRDSDRITIRQCLATLFTIHNETFNIWSHLLATLGFLTYFISIFTKNTIVDSPATYPLKCYAIGSCLLYFSSCFAHLFCCMSWRVRNTCFYLDHAAVSVYTFTSSQAAIFYCRPVTDDAFVLLKYPSIYLSCSISIACLNMFLGCLSRHRYREYRFVIRTGIYVVKCVFDIYPFLARCFVYETCTARAVYLFQRHVLCYAISALTNASRLPERLFPGYFDLFGYSHHFLHIFIILGNYDAFTVLHTDMIERKDILSASPYQPTFFTTFGLLILLISVNCVIVVWFVRNWLTAEEHELFSGSEYLVKKGSKTDDDVFEEQVDKKTQ